MVLPLAGSDPGEAQAAKPPDQAPPPPGLGEADVSIPVLMVSWQAGQKLLALAHKTQKKRAIESKKATAAPAASATTTLGDRNGMQMGIVHVRFERQWQVLLLSLFCRLISDLHDWLITTQKA